MFPISFVKQRKCTCDLCVGTVMADKSCTDTQKLVDSDTAGSIGTDTLTFIY